MNSQRQRELWLIITGALLANPDGRKELLDAISGTKAPHDLARLLRSVKENDGREVRHWFAQAEVYMKDGETCIQAISRTLSEHWKIAAAKKRLFELQHSPDAWSVELAEKVLQHFEEGG